jgi:hypothetical protein
MHDSLLRRYVRRNARQLLLLNGLLLLIVIGVFVATSRYYRNFFSGPYAMSRLELAALEEAGEADRYYVTLAGDEVLETGYQQVSQTLDKRTREVKSERVTADFNMLVLDRRLLMVKAEPGAARTEYVGALVDMPADLRQDLLASIRAEDPDVADGIDDALLPVMLDATGFKSRGILGLIFAIPVLGLAGFNLVRGFARLSDPQKHPALRALRSKGAFAELDAQIEAEVRTGTNVVTIGGATITPSWLISYQWGKLVVVPIGDIVWMYPHVTQTRVYGIPAGKSFAAAIKARPSVNLKIAGREDQIRQLLLAIAERAPWVLIGYTAALESDWKRNPGAVLTAVDQRRAQVLAQRQF